MSGCGTERRRVVIIGAGYVGSTIAYSLLLTGLAGELVLVDLNREKAKAEVLDIRHGLAGFDTALIRTGTYADCARCDLVIIAAGRNRRPGESRLELAGENVRCVEDIAQRLRHYGTRSAVLVVSNPVDILTRVCHNVLGLPWGRVFGSGCILDTSRMLRAAADHTGAELEAVRGWVIGEHGDTQVPVWSSLTVGGRPMQEACRARGLSWGREEQTTMLEAVKGRGAAIISGKGRTHYGIGVCVCALAEAVLTGRPFTASVSAPMRGEYGLRELSLSLPALIGRRGVERRLELKLEEEEIGLLRHSAACVKAAEGGLDKQPRLY